ncbi:MAG: hypothetical protein JO021_13485 [Alphaproteobacteria bacterium]|nr:hypothetical protein [Alphaproteobacteria bacterium]
MIPHRDPQLLAALKSRLRGLETAGGGGPVLPFGVPAIDARLPGGGLPRIGVHEVIAAPGPGAGFAAALAGRIGPAAPDGPACEPTVLWITRQAELYGPGLAAFGLSAARLVVVQAGHETDVLWALEEGLRTRGLAAVVGELHGLDLTAGRRLQLAAEAGGGTGFVLRPAETEGGAGAATSRWRVAAWPSRGGPSTRGWTCWRLALERCRGGVEPAHWIVEWDDATGDFALAAETGDRPAEPARTRSAADIAA